MRVDGHKRTIVLPGALAGYQPTSASLEDGSLVVGFDAMAEPRPSRPTRRPSGSCARRTARGRGRPARGGAVPPSGWSVPARSRRRRRSRTFALTALLEPRAASLPPELARQLAEALRELLIALRAVLDYSIDAPGAARRGAAARRGGHPDRLTDSARAEPPPGAAARSCSTAGIAAARARALDGPALVPEVVRAAGRRKFVQDNLSRVRRLHVRRGGDPAGRRRRAVPGLGALRSGAAFHLPGGDGVAISLAGGWALLLLVWRLFDKPELDGPGADVGIQWGIFVRAAGGRAR